MIFWVTMPFRPRRRSLGKGLGEAGIEPGARPAASASALAIEANGMASVRIVELK
jgi:hypothetical protein